MPGHGNSHSLRFHTPAQLEKVNAFALRCCSLCLDFTVWHRPRQEQNSSGVVKKILSIMQFQVSSSISALTLQILHDWVTGVSRACSSHALPVAGGVVIGNPEETEPPTYEVEQVGAGPIGGQTSQDLLRSWKGAC